MKVIPAISLGLLAVFCLAHGIKAATVIAPCNADTWIFSEAPDNNNGASDNFATGINAHGSTMRALLKFDLSGIPAGATINSVTLTLNLEKNQRGGGASFALNRMLKSWTEGAGGQFSNTGDGAQPGETSWNDRIQGSGSWGNPGGQVLVDYNPTESSTIFALFEPTITFASNVDFVADVQGWVNNPAGNFGWMMKDESEAPSTVTARRWQSRESGSGPTLAVDYTVSSPPPPTTPTISNVIHTNNQISFTFNADANRTYAVESRGDAASGTWATNTTYSASSVATNFTFTETILPANVSKYYRVRTP